MSYSFIREKDHIRTSGLVSLSHPEILLEYEKDCSVEAHEDLLQVIAGYIISSHVVIKSGEKISFGSWPLQLISRGDYLFVNEYHPSSGAFVPGANQALRLWMEQKTVCDQHKAVCTRPAPQQMIVTTDAVMNGEPAEGVRYPSPDQMSGWWITSHSYSGDESSLKTIHVMDVIAKRPDLGKFLALDYGFRFWENGAVAFDSDVARSE